MPTPRRLLIVPMMTGLAFLMASPSAPADPLDPTAYTSLGAFPSLAGTYTVNTSGTPTITGPGGTVLYGQDVLDASGHELAVFDFNSIFIQSNQTFSASGALPLVLLSRGDAQIGGTLDASAYGVSGPGALASGPGVGQSNGASGGSGGGFGTPGSPDQAGSYSGFNGSTPYSGTIPPVAGGSTYGDLSKSLVGGSVGGNGGAAGGAVEVGAVGTLSLLYGGQVLANGDSFATNLQGGGSGGGIFLHGSNVYIDPQSQMQVQGGVPGPVPPIYGGSGAIYGGLGGYGGNGRVLIEYQNSLSGSVSPLISSGDVIQYGPVAVPEPGTFLLATLTGVAIAARACLRGRKRPAA